MTGRLQRSRRGPPDGPAGASLDLPELAQLRELVRLGAPGLRLRVACEVALGEGPGRRLPVPVLTLGSDRPDAPAAGFFGGVHGIERIGAQVVLAHLHSLVMRLRWDEALRRQLETVRLVFMPLVNPGGVWLGTRANPNGVDLMRSAPVDAREPVAPLLGGHRIGPALPWYRGALHGPPEVECAALCEVVERELLGRPFAIALDCHSGFGLADRLWFPWAGSRQPIPHLLEVHALGRILDQSLLHHRYLLEPQSRRYLAHGDLWDHLYQRAAARGAGVFLPLTLEMGSWLWVRKNPLQILSPGGLFNPGVPHRRQRVLRRHLGGLDFIGRAAASWRSWMPEGEDRMRHREQALARWWGRDA